MKNIFKKKIQFLLLAYRVNVHVLGKITILEKLVLACQILTIGFAPGSQKYSLFQKKEI
jgi:hypothetical protein